MHCKWQEKSFSGGKKAYGLTCREQLETELHFQIFHNIETKIG